MRLGRQSNTAKPLLQDSSGVTWTMWLAELKRARRKQSNIVWISVHQPWLDLAASCMPRHQHLEQATMNAVQDTCLASGSRPHQVHRCVWPASTLFFWPSFLSSYYILLGSQSCSVAPQINSKKQLPPLLAWSVDAQVCNLHHLTDVIICLKVWPL